VTQCAKLYGDIRRESIQTAAIPIAVRHIESLIRMSEAHAKIHLRDYVTDDDVNVAIRMLLDSFIGAQKFSIKNSLRKKFEKYLSYKEDSFELLLHTLNELVREAVTYEQVKSGGTASAAASSSTVEVSLEDLQAKADDYGITQLMPFFKSDVFSRNGFVLDNARKLIVRTL